MTILGIDPGYGILGWSVITDRLEVLGYGVITTPATEAFDDRLFSIHRELASIIERYKPDCVSMEKLFFAKNTTTALNVAKAIGAVILTFKMANLSCYEYTPLQVKQALTGFGRATKEQMQFMITKVFKIKEIPKPDDAADALAIAACHAFRGDGIARYR